MEDIELQKKEENSMLQDTLILPAPPTSTSSSVSEPAVYQDFTELNDTSKSNAIINTLKNVSPHLQHLLEVQQEYSSRNSSNHLIHLDNNQRLIQNHNSNEIGSAIDDDDDETKPKIDFTYNACNAVQELLNVYGLSISPSDIVETLAKRNYGQQPATATNVNVADTNQCLSTILQHHQLQLLQQQHLHNLQQLQLQQQIKQNQEEIQRNQQLQQQQQQHQNFEEISYNNKTLLQQPPPTPPKTPTIQQLTNYTTNTNNFDNNELSTKCHNKEINNTKNIKNEIKKEEKYDSNDDDNDVDDNNEYYGNLIMDLDQHKTDNNDIEATNLNNMLNKDQLKINNETIINNNNSVDSNNDENSISSIVNNVYGKNINNIVNFTTYSHKQKRKRKRNCLSVSTNSLDSLDHLDNDNNDNSKKMCKKDLVHTEDTNSIGDTSSSSSNDDAGDNDNNDDIKNYRMSHSIKKYAKKYKKRAISNETNDLRKDHHEESDDSDNDDDDGCPSVARTGQEIDDDDDDVMAKSYEFSSSRLNEDSSFSVNSSNINNINNYSSNQKSNHHSDDQLSDDFDSCGSTNGCGDGGDGDVSGGNILLEESGASGLEGEAGGTNRLNQKTAGQNIDNIFDKCSLGLFSPILHLAQMQNEEKLLLTEQVKNLTRFGSYLECNTEQCRIENLREHFHCYDIPCFGKSLSKKEEIIRHIKWHKKRNESLNHGFLRFSSSDDCSPRFGPNCQHNRKQTHYHCFQPNCDKVYISTSDVQMHSNYHRKDSAIFQEGFQRFRATEECNTSHCMFSGQRTTHFHCRRDNCNFTFKNKADMEKHKTYHIKDLQLTRDGFKKFLKNEPCPYKQCRFSRICNHIHCIRKDCFYILHSSGQLLSHKRKHDRMDGEQAYQNYKMLQQKTSATTAASSSAGSGELLLPASTTTVATNLVDNKVVNNNKFINENLLLKLNSNRVIDFSGLVGGGGNSNNNGNSSSQNNVCDDSSSNNNTAKTSKRSNAKTSSPIDLSMLYNQNTDVAIKNNNSNIAVEFMQQIQERQKKIMHQQQQQQQQDVTATTKLFVNEQQMKDKNFLISMMLNNINNVGNSKNVANSGGSGGGAGGSIQAATSNKNFEEIDFMIKQYFTANCSKQIKKDFDSTTNNESGGCDQPLNLKNQMKLDDPYIECHLPSVSGTAGDTGAGSDLNSEDGNEISSYIHLAGQPHLHCLYKNCETVVAQNFNEIFQHIQFHEFGKTTSDPSAALQLMQNSSNLMQITSIEGFFNRKRGRPPKNRVVEVYSNKQQSPQAIFTSFKLEKNEQNHQQQHPMHQQIPSALTQTDFNPKSTPLQSKIASTGNAKNTAVPSFPYSAEMLRNPHLQQALLLSASTSSSPMFSNSTATINDFECSVAAAAAAVVAEQKKQFQFFQPDENCQGGNDCPFINQMHFHCMIDGCNYKSNIGHDMDTHIAVMHSVGAAMSLSDSLEESRNKNKMIFSPAGFKPGNIKISNDNFVIIKQSDPAAGGAQHHISLGQGKLDSSDDEKVSVVRAAGTYFPQNTSSSTEEMEESKSNNNETAELSPTGSSTPSYCQKAFCRLKRRPHDHCELCNQAFSDPTRLQNHRLKHSPCLTANEITYEQPQDLSIIPQKCNPRPSTSSSPSPNSISVLPSRKQVTLPPQIPLPQISHESVGAAFTNNGGLLSPTSSLPAHLTNVFQRNFIENLSVQNLHLAQLAALYQQNPFYYQNFPVGGGAAAAGQLTSPEFLKAQFGHPLAAAAASAAAAAVSLSSGCSNNLSNNNGSSRNALIFAAAAAAKAAENMNQSKPQKRKNKYGTSSCNSSGGGGGVGVVPFVASEKNHTIAITSTDCGGNSSVRSGPGRPSGNVGLSAAAKHNNFKMFKDEPVPTGYLKFRFNEDCNFCNCGYRNHQSHFHCVRNDCYYSFCDKTRFVQHTARHERLDKLMGDDFKQYRANMRCNYEECVYNKNFAGQNNKSSHFHCLKCSFICSDTNKVVAHRRQHSKAEFFRMAGFRKIANNEKCNILIQSGNDYTNGGECAYNMKQTHYHCLTCDVTVLSRAQLTSHKHRNDMMSQHSDGGSTGSLGGLIDASTSSQQ